MNKIDTRNELEPAFSLSQKIEKAAKEAACDIKDLIYQYGNHDKMITQVSKKIMFVSKAWPKENIPSNLKVEGNFPRGVYASTVTPFDREICSEELREAFYNQINGFQIGEIGYFIAMKRDETWKEVGFQQAEERARVWHICKTAKEEETTLEVKMICWGVTCLEKKPYKYHWEKTPVGS